MTQINFDDLVRGTGSKRTCRHLVRTQSTGRVVDGGMVILGRCGSLGGTAYDRRCQECDSKEVE